ncbi:probable peptidyl-prolyl cis-trans isomerase, FkbP-type [marine gamma proteobacterium HTCC2143]|jgi:FKBP-type peptidyl-prolyl cis-trans isomerase SlpA|uniref:Peptidyl-prolyl cis-trans isomerase n=1 Tax=marine gamma proteobacterium HTCC2143 TaxID=247633 RepID=A0YDV7_9GAMM|nr:probable peptidyl-prolyl cis-trans isomerase, FkbP-type [marine gamma proteobacterium HTCC2143]
MNNLAIAGDTKVTLHFSLKFEDGSVVDSTFDKEPATFTIGDGSLLDGFERKLFGLKAGEKDSFIVSPEDGFGQSNPNNVQRFSRGDFSADLELAEGLVISFADASQSELPGVVQSVDGDRVMVDFNHPLAGRNILFDVEIINVGGLDS